MPIQDTDLFLIEDTSGGSNKIEASKLKANLAANTYNDYLLLVNKSDYSACFVKAQNMQGSVSPSDFMMVERGDVSYRVTGQQVIDFFPSVPAGQAGPITDLTATENYVSAVTGTPDSSYPPDKAFDGNVSGSYGDGAKPATGTSLVWNTSLLPVVPTGSALKVYVYAGMGFSGGEQLVINGQEYVFAGSSDLNKVVEHDLTVNGAPGPLNTVKWTYTSSNSNYCYLKGIEIDGKLLIDNFQQLTLASDTNLSDFVEGDAINMVDVDGAVASYVPVTSTILNVDALPAGISLDTSFVDASIDYILSDYGVTSITGFGLDVRPDGAYTTELTAFKNNGVPVVTTATTYAGEAYVSPTVPANTYDWQSFFSNTPFRCQGLGVGTYACTISPVIPTTGNAFLLSSSGVGGGIFILDQNGNKVYIAGGEPNTSLILTDDQDLKYFKPGDAVQTGVTVISTDTTANTMIVDGGAWLASNGSGSGWNQSEIWSNPPIFNSNGVGDFAGRVIQNLFNGDTGTDYDDGAMPNLGLWNLNFTQFASATVVKIGGWFETASIIKVNGTTIPPSEWGSAVGVRTISVPVSGFTSLEWSGNYNSNEHSSLFFIDVNGVRLVDSGISGAPVVETQVTGPSKSGTGNFNGNTGSVVDVTNTNGDWIDNQNRLGTDFYIKAASTRNGLAVLRTKAIASAQTWSSGSNYPLYQLIKYGGRYWLALSSNSGVIPDANNPATWFDLGLI